MLRTTAAIFRRIGSSTPDTVAPHLTKDQLALYQLIWQRFIASQMQEALIIELQRILVGQKTAQQAADAAAAKMAEIIAANK